MEIFSTMEYIIVKNEEKLVPLEHDDITAIIFNSLLEMGKGDRLVALNLADKVICRLKLLNRADNRFDIKEMEQMIQFVLTEAGYSQACKFIPSQRTKIFSE